MKTWEPASREFVRIFFAHNQHIAVVTGRKPRHCIEVDLIRSRAPSNIPTFAIVMRPEKSSHEVKGAEHDHYYLVKPLFSGPPQSQIHVIHVDGTELVGVERIFSGGEIQSMHREESRSPILPAPATLKKASQTALGYSQNFSMEEAFTDALSHLPASGRSLSDRRVIMVDVVSMGAIYGGFSGFSRLFVKVEQSSAVMLPIETQKRAKRRLMG